MKPDRKQPARAPAMPARHSSKEGQSQGIQDSAQEPGHSQDWYVIADEGELTLRISNGLRVGEDRWGELTLNHPLSAHRWLEFSIDADGELWCRSSRKDIVIRCEGDIQDQVMLDPGVPIALPHNLLHISNHIRRGNSSDWHIEVGLLETQGNDEADSFDDLVDTQADVAPIPEPHTNNEHQTSGTASIEAELATNRSAGTNQLSTTQTSANDSVETFIPTLETVVVAPRPVGSEEAGPAIERAVAKLKNRSQAFGGQGGLDSADSTESALIPVDAEGPFHTDEIRAALQQPINVGEPGYRSSTTRSNNEPIYSPSVTTSIVAAVPHSRLRLVAGFAIALMLVLGAALLVAINASPDDQQQRSLGKSSATETGASTSASTTSPTNTTAEPKSTSQPKATNSNARTQSLLQTASALLSNPADLQPDTLDFAIRSLNLVLAAQPQNLKAQQLLTEAEQIRTNKNKPTVVAPTATPQITRPATPALGNSNAEAAAPRTDLYSFSDPRLARAAQLIAQGAILAPREGSAVSLIMSVLAEDASSPEAVRLLNRSASVLVAQADEEYETLGVYAARNTLEEVLSFHPKHGPANQRWRTWVATGSPMNAAPAQEQPDLGRSAETGEETEIDGEMPLKLGTASERRFNLEDTP